MTDVSGRLLNIFMCVNVDLWIPREDIWVTGKRKATELLTVQA